MSPYFLLLGCTVVFLTFSKMVKTDLFFYLSFVILVLFAGLRFDVGADFMTYSGMFVEFKNEKAPFLFEPANMFIINIVNTLDINHQAIFLIYSLISMSAVFYFIKKLSPSKELSILLFVTIGIFYFSTFNIIRQWAAISLMLIAIVKLIDAKHIQFVLFIILASLFHLSALILFVVVFFKIRFKFFYLIALLFGSMLVMELLLFIINSSKYAMYLNGVKFDQKGNPLLLLIYISILVYIPCFLGYFSRKKILNTQETVLLNMNIMSILFLILGYQLNIDFLSLMRVNMYFQIQLIVLIPMMMNKIKNQKINFMLKYLVFVFLFFYYFYTVYNNGVIYNLVPYQTVLEIL